MLMPSLSNRNHQLVHPLVSPALGYLGGLPPCLFIASDKELLRDEILYWYVHNNTTFEVPLLMQLPVRTKRLIRNVI